MAAPKGHWKLGLFVVVGFGLGLAALVLLGARSMHKDVVTYVSFFDESVQGLELGSPVKFRGVTVGNVAAIRVAKDRRRVEVVLDLGVTDLEEMGLSEGLGRKLRVRVPKDLRVQLASQGITGVKFLQLDFFDIKSYPPPDLPFAAPENYIPSAVSTLKNVEDAVVLAANRLPQVVDAILLVVARVGLILDDLDSKKIPEGLAGTLQHADQVLANLGRAVTALDTGALSGKAQAALAGLDATTAHLDALLGRVDGDAGVLASAQRATNAIGDVAAGSRGLGQEVEETLHDVQEVTAALQRVADALERDPDMLVKGRGKHK
jgi:phospholipid/cholesterol/gamma-HCH transport system substrate-binding protein